VEQFDKTPLILGGATYVRFSLSVGWEATRCG